MEEYSKKENYWYRRNAVEAFFTSSMNRIPNLKEKQEELYRLNNLITKRSESVVYRCVYLFRGGQKLNEDECDSRGGYADTWYRAHYYNLPFVDDDVDENPPMPGEPVKVKLKPSNCTRGYQGEYTVCWHPKCREYFRSNPLERSSVIFMFCHGHAEQARVREVHDFCLEGKPIQNLETKTMVEEVGQIIMTLVEKSLDQAILQAKEILEKEEVPDKVLEVRCYSFLNEEEDYEEVTYYVDLVSCIKIEK